MKILIVRHGEPNYEENTLTDKGFAEAKYLSEKLGKIKVDEIYSSPLNRAWLTAKPTADLHNKEIIVLDWLTEFPGTCLDPYTGKNTIPWNQMPELWVNKKEYYDIHTWKNEAWISTGTVNEKYDYVVNEFDKLLQQYGYYRDNIIYKCEENSEKTIVIFCHFALGMVLISHLCGISPVLLWQTMFLPTSSVTTFVTEERVKGEIVFKCMQLGDTSHLYANNEEVSKSGLYSEIYGGEGSGAIV